MAYHLAALTFDVALIICAMTASVTFFVRSIIVNDERRNFDFNVGAGLAILVIGRVLFWSLQ